MGRSDSLYFHLIKPPGVFKRSLIPFKGSNSIVLFQKLIHLFILALKYFKKHFRTLGNT
jgi:hypothetical protein